MILSTETGEICFCDVVGIAIPIVPAGLSKVDDGIKIVRRVDKGKDGAESVQIIETVGEETI